MAKWVVCLRKARILIHTTCSHVNTDERVAQHTSTLRKKINRSCNEEIPHTQTYRWPIENEAHMAGWAFPLFFFERFPANENSPGTDVQLLFSVEHMHLVLVFFEWDVWKVTNCITKQSIGWEPKRGHYSVTNNVELERNTEENEHSIRLVSNQCGKTKA